jgi:large subunit ribosomal protein L18
MAVDKVKRRLRIRRGIRKNISGTEARPRLSVFKSNKAIYAQVIDDSKGTTLASFSSFQAGIKGNATIESSKEVGKKVAEAAKASGISQVIFDRSGYKYHGQIKALAEGAREGGLEF